MPEMVGFDTSGMPELEQLLDRMDKKGADAAIDGVHNWLDHTFEVSQKVVPSGASGRLAEDAEVEYTSTGGVIRYFAPHARSVHFGYARHWVRPRTRKALAWEAKGKVGRLMKGGAAAGAEMAFSKGHMVPKRAMRSKPNPFLFRSVRATLPQLPDFMLQEYDDQVMEGD